MMLKKMKGLLSLFISISILSTVIPITGHAADTQPVSKLFSTTYGGSTTLVSKAVNKGLTPSFDNIKSVSFVDLNDYDLTGVKTVDYSADGDSSVLAWYDNNALYIGGYGKIIAGDSLSYAFYYGTSIDEINGFDMLDTSNVTDMSDMFDRCGSKSASFKLDLGNNFDTSNVTSMRYMFKECGSAEKNTGFTLNLGNKFDTSKVKNMSRMFNYCGWYSTVFTLDLGDKFDTSNVTSMDYMFEYCGYKSEVFKLDLGSKFDTSKVKDMSRMFADCGSASEGFTLNLGNKFKTANVTDMRYMFFECGKSSKNFTELDLSGFTISFSEANNLTKFAGYVPVTTFIFGNGWADAVLPEPGGFNAVFTSMSTMPTYITGATSNLVTYNWSADNRPVTFTDKGSVTITAEATEGGTVSGGGTVIESANVKLMASANEGYNFDGWYDGDTKVCDTEEFLVKNVTADKTYTAKFTVIIKKISKLFSTDSEFTLLSKAVSEGLVSSITDIRGVSFVDLDSYDITNVTTADYSADGDGYVLAWYDNKTLYIGGYETIIAGDSLAYAFRDGKEIDAINGIDMLDTSNVTNMASMFEECGRYSALFTLDLGNNFDTSNVTDMSHMFDQCGMNNPSFSFNLGNKFNTSKVTNMEYMFYFCGEYSHIFTLDLGDEFDTSNVTNMSYMFAVCGVYSEAFTLDFGDKFDTSKVTDMSYMFYYCGKSCPTFTELDLSGFTISISDESGLYNFAEDTSVTSFIFGDGWANAPLPIGGMFSAASSIATKVTGAPKNLFAYDWASDNREVTFTDKSYFTITAEADEGGAVSGSGLADTGESITLTATPDYGYTFDGWYDGDTRVCDTEEFTVENITESKTYTAKFTKIKRVYTIYCSHTEGGTISGGGDAEEGSTVTLTATTNEGYVFDGWYFKDTKISDTEVLVIENISEDNTSGFYIARFKKLISVTASAAEGGTVSGGGTVTEGESMTLTATANDGYTFDGWYDGDTKVCDTEEFVVSNVTENKTYTAKFTENVPDASYLFNTTKSKTLLGKIRMEGITEYGAVDFTAVHFVNLADYDLTGVSYSDYSANGDGSVKAWVNGTELYIGGYKKIIAGESLAFAFYEGYKIDSITGLEMLDTSNVTNMSYMFHRCGYNSTVFTLDLGDNFDTSKVTDMSYMFYYCGNKSPEFTLDLGSNFDTSSVTNMRHMFNCGSRSSAFTLDLGDKFDTSNVTDMSAMFQICGYDAKLFTLDLGDKFDTSKVTDMSEMFYQCGDGSTEFTLDLGPNFDTSSVTNMSEMFLGCGNKSSVFTLNLGDKFDTSNVTDMSEMFRLCGENSRVFALDLGDNFDTSNVTTMKDIFRNCGEYSPVFTLDLGNKFNTSKVTDMSGMFWMCGANSPVFTLDLGDKFDTSNATDMSYMFYYCGDKSTAFTLDLGDNFDTSNVTDMSNMFGGCGHRSPAFKLDLGDKFDTSKVTDMSGMFYYCGINGGAFTTIDLSSFTVSASTKLDQFAYLLPVSTFIFGDGWANAVLPEAGSSKGAFYSSSQRDTTVIGATENLINYDWASDKRTVSGLKPEVYTITVAAENGGTVSGGGKVEGGGSVTLTAAANDGYTFDGWYDGDTKVCDTAEFAVGNVTADKTYTAKFTKNQVVDPDPEPENPDIPYLKWDGSTLTLVKKADASCRVGIVYVGGATFDANNINWDKLVAVGKEYANLNSSVGYAVYNNFTKRTPGTRGNYVAFVKYTKEDGTTTADYITYSVKNAVSFEIPTLSYNVKTKALQMKGNVESTIGVAYIGDTELNAGDITWNDFIKEGKKYPDINGRSGYSKVLNTLDYAKTFDTNGNYVAFIKYFDENLNKTLAKYYTFTVDDYNSQPTDAPFAIAEENEIILAANGFNVTKVTIVYIGTDDMYITNWNDFSAAAAKFPDINGKALNQQYTNPKDGSAWKQSTAGWYGVYIRYIEDGKTCHSYYTVELN